MNTPEGSQYDRVQNIAWLTVGFVVILGMITFYFYQDIRVNHTFQQTSCTITNLKTVRYDRSVFSRHSTYAPLVQVAYEVNNMQYMNWTTASRIHPTVSLYYISEEVLKHYNINSNITCWYDPANPNIVYLEKGYHVLDALVVGVMLFILCMVLILYKLRQISVPDKTKIDFDQDYIAEGSFRIKKTFFTITYVYVGEEPLTPELLLPKFQKFSPRIKESMVRSFNRDGHFTAFAPAIARLIAIVFLAALAIVITCLLQLFVYQ
jgi:hypothetical protein